MWPREDFEKVPIFKLASNFFFNLTFSSCKRYTFSHGKNIDFLNNKIDILFVMFLKGSKSLGPHISKLPLSCCIK